jgi:hypothetical protein
MAVGADPFSAFAGSLGGGLGKGLGDAIGGGGGGPMVSGGKTDARSGMDGSGWAVATGGSKATGGARSGSGFDQTGLPSAPIGQQAGLYSAGLGGLPMLMLAGLAMYFVKRGGRL